MNLIFFGNVSQLIRNNMSLSDKDAIAPMCIYASAIIRDLFPTAARKFQGTRTGLTFEGHFMVDCARSLHLSYPLFGAVISVSEVDMDPKVQTIGKPVNDLPDVLVFVGREFTRGTHDLERRRLERRFRDADRVIEGPSLSHLEFMAAIKGCAARHNGKEDKPSPTHIMRDFSMGNVRASDVGLRGDWEPLAVVVGEYNDRYVQRCMTRKAITI